jgi:hypothetical protein
VVIAVVLISLLTANVVAPVAKVAKLLPLDLLIPTSSGTSLSGVLSQK